ncbi:MAG TPA: hypothetical protein DGB85_01195 [Deltaproteobacteria bacterium]|nr:hypothetical protein [Deltaproteobacteria bacterium]
MNKTINQILFFFLLTMLIGCSISDESNVESGSAAKSYNLNDKKSYFNGKLVKKGICINYVIQVNDINFPQELIENKWTDESSNILYKNVFTLENVCDFPENIDEGYSFKFKIGNNPKKYCAVCKAYTPVPAKHIKILIIDN